MGARRYFGGVRIIHRHRVGDRTMCCVHELSSVAGHPALVLNTIDNGGMRVPLFTIQLDPAKLHYAAGAPHIAFYDDVTVDPRYEGFSIPKRRS